MTASSPAMPQALGAEAQENVRDCLFCGTLLDNRGSAFLDHVKVSEDCGAAYEAWLERLNEDRPGG